MSKLAVTSQQKDLLGKIKKTEKELFAHEKEAEKMQRKERFFCANDEKAEADGCIRTLIKLLEEALDLKMNTQEFPAINLLVEQYITIPNRALEMAEGGSCH